MKKKWRMGERCCWQTRGLWEIIYGGGDMGEEMETCSCKVSLDDGVESWENSAWVGGEISKLEKYRR